MHFKFFSIKEIQNFINENNLAIHKKYSQNFLINSGVVDTIIKFSKINKDDLIIEIGCGLGSLTHKLIATNCSLIGVEVDKAYIKFLKSQFENNKNFTLIEGDFLKEIDQIKNSLNKNNYSSIKILGNLPYNITTPILDKIFTTPLYFDLIIFMMQKEVAERIIAKEGTKKFGSLSIFSQFYSEPKIIAKISPKSFYPTPKVESSLVYFEKKENKYQVLDKKLFFKITRSIFINRRKQIKNNLILSPLLKEIDKNKIIEALNNSNIPLTIRGEMLSIDKIVNFSNELYKNINENKV